MGIIHPALAVGWGVDGVFGLTVGQSGVGVGHRSIAKSGGMTMASAFRLIFYALLAVPTYWTADKLLQIYATSIAKDRVLAQVQDEKYLSQLFAIPLPFQYANYEIIEGKSLKVNGIARQLAAMKERQTKPFKLYFKYTDGVERKHWYEYPTEGCTVVYCTYNPALLQPIPPLAEKDVAYVVRDKRIHTEVLLYSISVQISLVIIMNGKIGSIEAHIANKGRNPIDRTVRQLSAALAPDFWQIKWSYSFNPVNGIILEKDY